MAPINQIEFTDTAEYAAHLGTYRAFIRVLWSVAAGIALALIYLAIFWT